MSEIRFYHMEQSTIDKALPAITMKAVQSGKKILIKAADKKEVKRLSDLLWSFRGDTFLAHGMDGDKNAEQQPVFVTTKDDNVNEAKILILTGGCTHEDVAQFDLTCEMLDGRVESQIADARARWKVYKEADHDLTYWQQDDNGAWGKRA
ncbi:MAG: DNA polymerase III subunit chi [Alphaproteobacteria bacterium]|nr:MAG: DNA polymerase III subunit chi [Alphaproteobacteria bacterium]